MFGIEATNFDKQVYAKELADFLPDKIVDAHVHLWTPEAKQNVARSSKVVSWPDLVAPDCTYEDLMASYDTMFPQKKVVPVIMTMPTVDLSIGNSYVQEVSIKHRVPSLYCTRPETGEAEIRNAMKTGFCGIKPYLNHAPDYIPRKEIRIFDFVTPQQFELMNELGGVVMLHISRDDRLADPLNIAQLMEIDRKYPNAKVIVAHIGRAYTPDSLGNAFDTLKDSKNLFFDFTATTYTPAIVECIKAVGTKRLMFGSDMPITKMRMYRIIENGIYVNVVPRGMYGDVSYDKNMKETDETDITTFMYEELIAFKRAVEELKLTAQDVEDMMCNNAVNFFGMEI